MHRLTTCFPMLILGMMVLPAGSAIAQTQGVHQDTISFAEGSRFDPADPANASQGGPLRCYLIPLIHITPDIFLSEIDQADVPNDDLMILKPGQSARNVFRVEGVDAAIANRRNNTLLVYCTVYGYDVMHQIAHCLDVPSSLTDATRPSGYAPGEKEYEGDTHPQYHFFELPLRHTHPKFILTELNQAYLPNNGLVILGPGEAVCNGFKMEGLRLLIPNRRNNSFLVYSSFDGFAGIKVIVEQLDQPAPLDTDKK